MITFSKTSETRNAWITTTVILALFAGLCTFAGARMGAEEATHGATAQAHLQLIEMQQKHLIELNDHVEQLEQEVRDIHAFLSKPVVEHSAVESLSTTPERIDCGRDRAPSSWKCIDNATGGITVYRGDASVTSSGGYPESADTKFSGDSEAWLVLASGTLDVRCTCGE